MGKILPFRKWFRRRSPEPAERTQLDWKRSRQSGAPARSFRLWWIPRLGFYLLSVVIVAGVLLVLDPLPPMFTLNLFPTSQPEVKLRKVIRHGGPAQPAPTTSEVVDGDAGRSAGAGFRLGKVNPQAATPFERECSQLIQDLYRMRGRIFQQNFFRCDPDRLRSLTVGSFWDRYHGPQELDGLRQSFLSAGNVYEYHQSPGPGGRLHGCFISETAVYVYNYDDKFSIRRIGDVEKDASLRARELARSFVTTEFVARPWETDVGNRSWSFSTGKKSVPLKVEGGLLGELTDLRALELIGWISLWCPYATNALVVSNGTDEHQFSLNTCGFFPASVRERPMLGIVSCIPWHIRNERYRHAGWIE